MKVLVPVKRVVDPYAKVRALPDGSGIDSAGAKFEINPFDEIAVEQAVRMKEAGQVTEVVAVSVGRPECEEQLRKALAIGADRAILVETDELLDSSSVAAVLAQTVAKESPQLVLMGKQATDDDGGQAAQRLAHILGWPQAMFIADINISGNGFEAVCESDTGEIQVSLPSPCVVSVDLRLNEPRYIALPGIIKARSKPLERTQPQDIPLPRTKTLNIESVPPRQAGIKVGSVVELAEAIKSKGVL
jgi:electron transfer flavoprotein beta subunit